MSEPLILPSPSPSGDNGEKFIEDKQLFKLSTQLTDSMQHGDLLFRDKVLDWGGIDLYPQGRVIKLELFSPGFSLEATFLLIRKGTCRGYRVTSMLLEDRRWA